MLVYQGNHVIHTFDENDGKKGISLFLNLNKSKCL